MKRVVLLRHGETAWSRSGQHTGITDIPLTGEGQRQARQLGRTLGILGIDPVRVLSSPRRRAVQTAQYAGLSDRMETTELLGEVDYGDYEGLTTAQIRERDPAWNLFRDGCPGGETFAQAGERADQLLADLTPEEGSGDVVLIGHGHFSRVVGARYAGWDAGTAQVLALSTASVSVLGHEHEWRAIVLWNHRPSR